MPNEAHKLFTVPVGSRVTNLGGGEFHVEHPDGHIEYVRLFPAGRPLVERTTFNNEPKLILVGDPDAA